MALTEYIKKGSSRLGCLHKRPLIDRLMERCIPEPNSGCWLWVGHYNPETEYGLFSCREDGKTVTKASHKWMYEFFKGKVPKGKMLRHTCDMPPCVNPDHLLVGTQKDNLDDMVARNRQYWGKQTHCKQGHEFSPENTRTRGGSEGGRRCITCARLSSKKNYRNLDADGKAKISQRGQDNRKRREMLNGRRQGKNP